MTIPEDVNSRSARFFGKRMLLVIIILVGGLAFGLWYFFIFNSNNVVENSDVYLPPNCYSVNGKQICPPPKS